MRTNFPFDYARLIYWLFIHSTKMEEYEQQIGMERAKRMVVTIFSVMHWGPYILALVAVTVGSLTDFLFDQNPARLTGLILAILLVGMAVGTRFLALPMKMNAIRSPLTVIGGVLQLAVTAYLSFWTSFVLMGMLPRGFSSVYAKQLAIVLGYGIAFFALLSISSYVATAVETPFARFVSLSNRLLLTMTTWGWGLFGFWWTSPDKNLMLRSLVYPLLTIQLFIVPPILSKILPDQTQKKIVGSMVLMILIGSLLYFVCFSFSGDFALVQ